MLRWNKALLVFSSHMTIFNLSECFILAWISYLEFFAGIRTNALSITLSLDQVSQPSKYFVKSSIFEHGSEAKRSVQGSIPR